MRALFECAAVTQSVCRGLFRHHRHLVHIQKSTGYGHGVTAGACRRWIHQMSICQCRSISCHRARRTFYLRNSIGSWTPMSDSRTPWALSECETRWLPLCCAKFKGAIIGALGIGLAWEETSWTPDTGRTHVCHSGFGSDSVTD